MRRKLEKATCKIPHIWRRYGGGFVVPELLALETEDEATSYVSPAIVMLFIATSMDVFPVIRSDELLPIRVNMTKEPGGSQYLRSHRQRAGQTRPVSLSDRVFPGIDRIDQAHVDLHTG